MEGVFDPLVIGERRRLILPHLSCKNTDGLYDLIQLKRVTGLMKKSPHSKVNQVHLSVRDCNAFIRGISWSGSKFDCFNVRHEKRKRGYCLVIAS